MSENTLNERYQVINFKAKTLEKNPINSPVERKLAIYLPPDYFKTDKKYHHSRLPKR